MRSFTLCRFPIWFAIFFLVAPGDVVLAVDGRPVTKIDELIDRLEQFKVGDRVEPTIYRNDVSQRFSTVLGPAGLLRPVVPRVQESFLTPLTGLCSHANTKTGS